jgi:hypothetical protein
MSKPNALEYIGSSFITLMTGHSQASADSAADVVIKLCQHIDSSLCSAWTLLC